ncbi:hypothetical protein BC835DRAFT_1477466 [Cytidiella melzeri]|nr:hypothetical protein BC835DRAFT_1477466 [Cytidiella melzeri]
MSVLFHAGRSLYHTSDLEKLPRMGVLLVDEHFWVVYCTEGGHSLTWSGGGACTQVPFLSSNSWN